MKYAVREEDCDLRSGSEIGLGHPAFCSRSHTNRRYPGGHQPFLQNMQRA